MSILKVIINLPCEKDTQNKQLLQENIDTFISALIFETIDNIASNNSVKKAIATEILNIISEKAKETQF